MAEFNFIATHGVQFADEFGVWARFVRDTSLDTPTGEKRYTFGTDDESTAERVRAVNDYGITEVDVPAADGDADSDTGDSDDADSD